MSGKYRLTVEGQGLLRRGDTLQWPTPMGVRFKILECEPVLPTPDEQLAELDGRLRELEQQDVITMDDIRKVRQWVPR